MKIKNPKTPARNEVPDVPSEAAWVDGMLGPRDETLEEVVTCLQGQCGIDNKNEEVRTLQVMHGEPEEIRAMKVRGKILGASLIDWDLDDTVQLVPKILDQNKIRLRFLAGTDPGTPFSVTVLLIGP